MCAKIWIAQFQNMKDCAFSLQNNKIIDILNKKIQENKKPIRHRCGLVKCGGLIVFIEAQKTSQKR